MFWPNVTDKAAPVTAKIFQDIWNMIWQLSIYLDTLLSLFVNSNVRSVKKDTKRSSNTLRHLVSFFTERTLLINTIFCSFSPVWIDRLPFSERCPYEILKLDQSH